MVAYEFYLHDTIKGNELVGILPERRKDPTRITHRSVLHWAETVLGNSLSNKDIYYIKITITKDKRKIFRPTSFIATQQKVKK